MITFSYHTGLRIVVYLLLYMLKKRACLNHLCGIVKSNMGVAILFFHFSFFNIFSIMAHGVGTINNCQSCVSQ